MKGSRLALLTLLVVSGSALAACGGGGSSTTGTTAGDRGGEEGKKAPSVALLLNSHSDFQAAYEKGLGAVLSPVGGKFTPFISNFEPTEEASQCQAAVTSGRYDAIVVEPIAGPTTVPCATEAHAAGVPVISLEDGIGPDEKALKPTVPGVVGQIVIVESEAIEQQVALMKQACEGIDPCQVIAEISAPGDPATNNPLKAMERELPNVQIVGRFPTNYDSSLVAKNISEQLTVHPEADVFFSIADSSAQAALPTVEEMGLLHKLKIIGYGGSVEGVEGIKRGDIFATLALFPRSMGEVAGEMAIQSVNGEPIPNSGVNANKLGTPAVVTKGNVDEFEPQWGRPSE